MEVVYDCVLGSSHGGFVELVLAGGAVGHRLLAPGELPVFVLLAQPDELHELLVLVVIEALGEGVLHWFVELAA